MIPESNRNPRAICVVLNRLIGACEDDVLVHSAGAGAVAVADSDMLMGPAQQRRAFVRQLSSMVVEHGGRPRARNSPAQRAHILFHQARDLFIGHNSGDAYADSAHVEAKAERLYAVALAGPLPNAVRSLIERQHAEIARDREMFRRKRFLS